MPLLVIERRRRKRRGGWSGESRLSFGQHEGEFRGEGLEMRVVFVVFIVVVERRERKRSERPLGGRVVMRKRVRVS
jgi:hypothetical protein